MRVATHDDVERIIDMGERFVREKYAGHIGVSREASAATLAMMIESPNMLLLVEEHGVIGVILFKHPFSGELVASETFWWVDPEHRGAGIRLMREAERWARERGAVKMQMGEPAGSAMARFYERVGYAPIESTYQREL